MHELLQKQTCTAILGALEDLPSGLPAIYSRMLLQVLAERRRTSSAILRWVTLTLRPLELQELAAAVGIHRSSLLITPEQAIRDEITFCGPFLKIQERKVSLAHQSARDYLLRNERDNDAVFEVFQLELENAHLEIAQACLDCVTHSDLQHAVVDLNNRPPLLRYAALHWPGHAKNCSVQAAKLSHPARPFFQRHFPLQKHWIVTYKKIKVLDLPASLPLLCKAQGVQYLTL